MATETTTASAISTDGPPSDVGFRPLDWWVGVTVGPQLEPQRRIPPIPAFVRLSRLIDPEKVSAARGAVPIIETVPGTEHESEHGCESPGSGMLRGTECPGHGELPATECPGSGEFPEPLDTESIPVAGSGWADSAGRPLFRIGLAAIVAAIVVAVLTFAQQDDGLTTVATPEAAAMFGPGFEDAASPVGGPTTWPDATIGDAVDDPTHDVLEALVRQTSDGADADLSVAATASGSGADIRWTATVRNAGPGTAEGPITVVQTIGSEFELVSITGAGWECDHLRATGTITCELDEDLAGGRQRRLGLVTSTAGVVPGTSIPSTMSVVAGTNDPNLDNNTINITAVTTPADNGDGDSTRSSSAGAAGESGSDTDTAATTTDTADTSESADSGQTASTGMDELPQTGSGLVIALGAAGVMLCLIGRRLMAWSARAQTRTMLAAADIE